MCRRCPPCTDPKLYIVIIKHPNIRLDFFLFSKPEYQSNQNWTLNYWLIELKLKKAKQLNFLVRCPVGKVYSNRLGLESFDHLRSLPSLLPFLRPLWPFLPFFPSLPRLPCRPTGCRLGLGQGHSPPQQSFMENASFWSRLHQALTLCIFSISIQFSEEI